MGNDTKKTFFKRRHNDQQVSETMLNIINYQKNQNHNEILPPTC